MEPRHVIEPPSFKQLGDFDRSRLDTIDRGLRALRILRSDRPPDWGREIARLYLERGPEIRSLRHPLSDHAPHLWNRVEPRWNPRPEFEMAMAIKRPVADMLWRSKMPLAQLLPPVAAALGLPYRALRQDDARGAADQQGRRVRYPPASLLAEGLAALDARIHDRAAPRIWIALTLLIGILNLHPFGDGNGRISRALFNIALDHSYLPLWNFWACSRGGFQLYQRGIELNQDWAGMIRYFAAVTSLVEHIGTNSTAV